MDDRASLSASGAVANLSDDASGLLFALRLDDRSPRPVTDWSAIQGVGVGDDEGEGVWWVHMDRKHPGVHRWLRERSGLTPAACDALLAEDTRPRFAPMGGGVLLILRGVNLNPGATPDDMISLRLWVEPRRVLSLRFPRLMAVGDVRSRIERGEGPSDVGGLVVALSSALAERIGPVLSNLDELIDGLEERFIADEAEEEAAEQADGGVGVAPPAIRRETERDLRSLRGPIASVRRQAITLRRYIGPQRDALLALSTAAPPWLDAQDRVHLFETVDRVTRYVEDLDAVRERAVVIQEELLARQSDWLNRNMYIMALVATVFLPLGFITGLLGINVGGMPGVDSASAFWIVCAVLVVLGVAEWALYRWMRML